MKKMACEVCGGNLIKKDNYWVCENCGGKYTTEEAKKLLVEVDITGSSVIVENNAKYDNLIKLANMALDGKNYPEAERQANTALTMQSDNYEAYVIKARAINAQSTDSQSRIREAFNCYINACKLLNAENKFFDNDVGKSIDDEIVKVIEDEIVHQNSLIYQNGPYDKTINNSINSFKEICDMMDAENDKDDSSFLDLENLKTYITNYFIEDVNHIVCKSWDEYICYQYYQDSMDNCGSDWITNGGRDETDAYRPNDETFNIFCNRIDWIVYVIDFALGYKNKDTSKEILSYLYGNKALFLKHKRDAVSFRRYSYYNKFYDQERWFWQRNLYWNNEAKENMDQIIDQSEKLSNNYKALYKKEENERKKAEAKERFDAYWSEHKDERLKLESEKKELEKKITAIKKEIAKIKDNADLINLNNEVTSLQQKKKNLGAFKLKEKSEIKKQIDGVNAEIYKLNLKIEKDVSSISFELNSLENKLKKVVNELTKER